MINLDLKKAVPQLGRGVKEKKGERVRCVQAKSLQLCLYIVFLSPINAASIKFGETI